jgi:hypothetical protein
MMRSKELDTVEGFKAIPFKCLVMHGQKLNDENTNY